jgi:UDPglucose--hexose-1-phosphate uridylyltransferase
MSEIRRDPIRGGWVIVVPERTRRPQDFAFPETRRAGLPDDGGPGDAGQSSDPADAPTCPFCEERERIAGWELLAWRPGQGAPNTPGWQVRVVANREPALRVESDLGPGGDELFPRFGGLGAHEVIIESPRHTDVWPTMAPDAVARVLWAWRERMRDLKRDFRLRSFLVVKNHGPAAGAKIDHPHSQLLAFPFVPPVLDRELQAAAGHFEHARSCVFCDVIAEEIQLNLRVVVQDGGALALTPFASRVPFETWVLPRLHEARFEDASDAVLLSVASRVQDVLRRLAATLRNPPFNLVLHTAPVESHGASYHWHIEIAPRLAAVSGLEWGSGVFVNPVPPEEAAAVLRESLGS